MTKVKPITQTSAMIVVKALEKRAQPLTRKVTDMAIKTREDYETAASVLHQLKEIAKEADKEKRTFTVPLQQLTKAVAAHFKPFETNLLLIETDTKQRMVVYLEKIELAASKVVQQLEAGKIKKVSTALEKQAQILAVSNEDAKVRKVWQLTIVDAASVPRKYCVPDENAIREVFKAGGNVAGCKWEQVKQIAI